MNPAPSSSPLSATLRGVLATAGVMALTSSALGVIGLGTAGSAVAAPVAAATVSTSPTPTVAPTVSPTATPTASPTPTVTPTPTVAPTPTPTPTPTPPPPLPPSVTGSDITVVQANLESPQSVAGFQADVAAVRGQAPDLITYNEVAFRHDLNLAPPPGYAMFRTPGQYTGATPVAWRTDKWSALQVGTEVLTDHRGVPKGKSTELGRRSANWVILQSPEGRIVSLVSAHLAPKTKDMPDLRRPGVERLVALVDRLDDHGPVMVGGDFNMHHLGTDYSADLFTSAGLVPTYDLLGTRFPTYDGNSATIDYIFLKGSDQLRADVHYPVELSSDHDAVVAGFSWTTDAAALVTMVENRLDGTAKEKRAVLRALQQPVRDAEKNSKVQIASTRVALPALTRDLVNAAKRGVKVQLTTRSGKLTPQERALKAELRGSKGSWVRRCVKKCAKKWQKDGRPDTLVLVSDTSRQAILRLDVDRQLRKSIIKRQTRLTESHGPLSLDDANDIFRDLR